MNRRDAVLALVGLGASACPIKARAQDSAGSRVRTIGTLSRLPRQEIEPTVLRPFRDALNVRGWAEGKNLTMHSSSADFKAERFPELAEDLVRRRVDLIWATGAEAAIAAARASRTIPIVFIVVPWPVETGLADSYARPGRNVTGVSTYTGVEVGTKRLEFLKEISPAATRLSWVLDSGMEATVDGGRFDLRPALETAAKSVGYEVRFHYAQRNEDFDRVFAEIVEWRAQALAVAASVPAFAARERIVAFALRHRLPSAFIFSQFVEAGGLLSYANAEPLTATIARSAEYVDRIFRGARPADLPIERPSRYELVINLKTARAIGVRIPQPLLVRADRVIE